MAQQADEAVEIFGPTLVAAYIDIYRTKQGLGGKLARCAENLTP